MEGFSQHRSPSVRPRSSVPAGRGPATVAVSTLIAAAASKSARAASQSISGPGEAEQVAAAKRCASEPEILCSLEAALLSSSLRPLGCRPAPCSQRCYRVV